MCCVWFRTPRSRSSSAAPGTTAPTACSRNYRAASVKIGRPVMQRVENAQARSLQQRLPDGRPPDRQHPGGERAPDASVGAAAHARTGSEGERKPRMSKLAVADLMPLEQYARERPGIRTRGARAQGAAATRRGPQLQLALRRSPHGAVPGTGDAAHRAHLRARRHRRGTRRLQPADPRRQQLEGDAAAGVRTGRAPGARSPASRASRTAAGCRSPAASASSRSRTRICRARTPRRPPRCTSCALNCSRA